MYFKEQLICAIAQGLATRRDCRFMEKEFANEVVAYADAIIKKLDEKE